MNFPEAAAAPDANAPASNRDAASVTVALDAMGADFAPECAVRAAEQALHRDSALNIRLLADSDTLSKAVGLSDRLGPRLIGIETAEFIAMDSSPAEALRRGRESSMALALAEVAQGRADAVVSSGNTGALMALARSTLGMLSGIERPALMTEFPV
ncbi:MAG: hypothetical protein ACPGJE_10475, partial [Wenzhouxiangellaceae bacterium]